MGVSVNTVSIHLKNVYCKLGVPSKTARAVVEGTGWEGVLSCRSRTAFGRSAA
jgi:hypothetical protein